MGFLSRLTGATSDPAERAPGRPGGGVNLLGGPGWEDVEVAGESYHRKEIARLFMSWGLREGGVTMRIATLVPEPTNRYDKNAVRVMVDGALVGYVPAEEARRIGAQCARLPRGEVAACSVRIWAKRADGEWPARVTLAFSGSAEGERDFAAEEEARRLEERRLAASQRAGQVRGAWWGQQRGAVAELKRQGRLDEALALVDECSAAAERAGIALGERPDPWPVEQQSILLRKLKDPVRELAALERYATACAGFGVPDKIAERLNRARVAVGGVVGGGLDAETAARPDAGRSPTSAPPAPAVETAAPPLPPASWYEDPTAPTHLRWWDGFRWTEHTAPRP